MQIKQWIPAILGIRILGAGAPKVNSDDLKARELFITKVDQPIIIDGYLSDAPAIFYCFFRISLVSHNFRR